MPTDRAWLAPPTGGEAVPAARFEGDPLAAAWLPDEPLAAAWMQYVKDTRVPDASPPPAPTRAVIDGGELRWEAEADPQSGLAAFRIERDGRPLVTVPEKGANPVGRPLFQNLQYSDTPSLPLVPMRYVDTTAQPGTAHEYRIRAVNTLGLESAPSAPATPVAAAR